MHQKKCRRRYESLFRKQWVLLKALDRGPCPELEREFDQVHAELWDVNIHHSAKCDLAEPRLVRRDAISRLQDSLARHGSTPH